MATPTFEQLVEAGCHFGHLKRKWNPAMAPYIFMERNGIHIIDLNKTVAMVDTAAENTVSIKEDIDESLALSMARNAAIPQGQVLSNIEMENIVNSLFLCKNPNVTPDGKTILCILKQSEIEHLLG